MADLYLALLHYPVYDKDHKVVTTSITNMDIHDIARSARTYGVRRYFANASPPSSEGLPSAHVEMFDKANDPPIDIIASPSRRSGIFGQSFSQLRQAQPKGFVDSLERRAS
jgi:hypothetical protein